MWKYFSPAVWVAGNRAGKKTKYLLSWNLCSSKRNQKQCGFTLWIVLGKTQDEQLKYVMVFTKGLTMFLTFLLQKVEFNFSPLAYGATFITCFQQIESGRFEGCPRHNPLKDDVIPVSVNLRLWQVTWWTLARDRGTCLMDLKENIFLNRDRI